MGLRARRASARTPDEQDWAADFDDRQFVRVDTNYKSSRPGEHPVDLTRVDAVHFAAAIIAAIEDTFHYTRVGELRASEAAQLLSALTEVDFAMTQLRDHALGEVLVRRLAERTLEAAGEVGGRRERRLCEDGAPPSGR